MMAKRVSIDGSADILVNSKLHGDYFFNRARMEGCENPRAMVERVAKPFWQSGLDCYLYDMDGNSPKGTKQIDTMHVLVADGSKAKPSGKLVSVDSHLLPVWIDVFCKAFEVPEWKAEVQRIFRANLQKTELILAYNGGAPVGCAG